VSTPHQLSTTGPCLVARGERRGGAFRVDTTSALNDGTVFSCTGRKEGRGLSYQTTRANLQGSVYFSSVGNSWKKPEDRPSMRPDVLRVPAGFNFDRPAVNITQEDFGGMMDDNLVIIETVHCWTALSYQF
jgi:hypothetical protein